MPTFKLRAKSTLGPGGCLPKGTVFQVITANGTGLDAKKIQAAIKQQLGLDLPESSCYASNFEQL